ncbi:MAG: lpxD [Parachlamydiales bacterium]|nr:lpxD [Parachlamydiales bacterium]
MQVKSFTLAELADQLRVELIGNPLHVISGANAIDKATSVEASFLANPRYREAMKESAAGVICIDRQTPTDSGKNYFVCDDPSRVFQQIIELFISSQMQTAFTGIHPTAMIDPSAILGAGVSVGPYAVIDAHVRIGDRTRIDAHTFIGAHVEIGQDGHIYPSCVVRERCCIGHRVILQSGAIIGSCGFGYTTDKTGCHHKLEQLGIVVIEDDVEIGANTTIDRSRFDMTIIRRGTKIDNLVQIAHNVEIGAYNLIAAQTGIAGSAKTGHHVMMGGQAGVLGHVEIDDMTMIATRSGVSKSIKSGKYRGSPAIPVNEFNRQEVHVRRLEGYVERIKQLEKKIAELEKADE